MGGAILVFVIAQNLVDFEQLNAECKSKNAKYKTCAKRCIFHFKAPSSSFKF